MTGAGRQAGLYLVRPRSCTVSGGSFSSPQATLRRHSWTLSRRRPITRAKSTHGRDFAASVRVYQAAAPARFGKAKILNDQAGVTIAAINYGFPAYRRRSTAFQPPLTWCRCGLCPALCSYQARDHVQA